jgi:hypothetical protein
VTVGDEVAPFVYCCFVQKIFWDLYQLEDTPFELQLLLNSISKYKEMLMATVNEAIETSGRHHIKYVEKKYYSTLLVQVSAYFIYCY